MNRVRKFRKADRQPFRRIIAAVLNGEFLTGYVLRTTRRRQSVYRWLAVSGYGTGTHEFDRRKDAVEFLKTTV